MNWFEGVTQVNEVKGLYRRLALRFHPDRKPDGDTRKMQEINSQYEQMLKGAHGQVSCGDDGKEHTYYWNEAVEREVMEKILETLAKNLPVEVDLVGTWIWLSGTRKDDMDTRNALKELKYRWHSKRQLWFYHTKTYRHKYTGIPMEDLRRAYGSRRFDTDETAVAVA